MKSNQFVVFGLVGLFLVSLNSSTVHAFAKAAPSASTTSTAGTVLSSLETLALDVAIDYAETDPHYAPVLAALNIHSASDVEALLAGDTSGINIKNVVAYLIIEIGQKDPKTATVLNNIGAQTFTDVLTALKNPSSLTTQTTLFQIAYDVASSEPTFEPWLQALGITSATQLQGIANGTYSATNLEAQLIAIGVDSLVNHQSLSASAANMISALQLGAYQGLPLATVSQITTTAAAN